MHKIVLGDAMNVKERDRTIPMYHCVRLFKKRIYMKKRRKDPKFLERETRNAKNWKDNMKKNRPEQYAEYLQRRRLYHVSEKAKANSAARNKRYRQKMKDDPERYTQYKRKAKIRNHRRYEKIRNDPVLYAKRLHKHRIWNRTWGNGGSVERLFRDLSGVIYPRPSPCTGRCRTSYFESHNVKERILQYQRWCVLCACILNDIQCECCKKRTRNLFNLSAYKRRQWDIAEDVDLCIMLYSLYKYEEPEQIMITVVPYNRGNASC